VTTWAEKQVLGTYPPNKGGQEKKNQKKATQRNSPVNKRGGSARNRSERGGARLIRRCYGGGALDREGQKIGMQSILGKGQGYETTTNVEGFTGKAKVA